jgi:DNA repair photolyase
LLEAMCDEPPDLLILQTHSHRVADFLPLIQSLSQRCKLRVHVSIESDRETLPGLPPPASSVENRLAACATLRAAGIFTVVTVSPLLPIADPPAFFARIAASANAVVLDHFIGGDGSSDGNRTLRTRLPQAMQHVAPDSVNLSYRDAMATVAQKFLPDRVGVNIDGFAGRWITGHS